MTEAFQYMRQCLPGVLAFLALVLLSARVNLKREYRGRQILMPLTALIYGIFVMAVMTGLNNRVFGWLEAFAKWLSDAESSLPALSGRGEQLLNYLDGADIGLLLFSVENTAFMAVFIIFKGIILGLMKAFFKADGSVMEVIWYPFYEKDRETHRVYLREECRQARTYLKTMYIAAVSVLSLLALISCYLYHVNALQAPFYPAFAVIVAGELYFALGGITKCEAHSDMEGEEDRARHMANYSLMREVLRKLFPDKLGAESTTVKSAIGNYKTNREVLTQLEEDEKTMIEAYGRFLGHKLEEGMELDHSYVNAGKELLEGNSVLFNNPFYYDLIPYLFYPMNRQMLNHKRVLLVLGRHGIEAEIEAWCRDGLAAVNHTPTLWRIGVMGGEKQALDVGILTRSMVHDLSLHEANAEFFSEVGMMILLEPSRLMTTAQIGLNSLVRCCSAGNVRPVFVSIDKNCDGLLDALSHILMTSLVEVSATNHHMGRSTYMCWDGDSDHLQHRLLPNLSRYLGLGTELSAAALKNQIENTCWYGGDAFPVVDISWIAGQYYYDLLNYASLPAAQETLTAKFHVTPQLWNAKQEPQLYLTVEDEFCNLFEIKRNFATRAVREGFINIISPEYLLKDYMTENESIFNADPKAIPYLVADYAHTVRNVVLRLCLRMSVGPVWESELERELLLIDAPVIHLTESLWHEICKTSRSAVQKEKPAADVLTLSGNGRMKSFTKDVIRFKRRFNIRTGKMESCYFIDDPAFIHLYVDTLRNAEYIAEDEQGNRQYLGSEILGQVFQKLLPGQFVTIAGKNYEMLRVSSDSKVILRRAADHITGRPHYRQVRNYALSNLAVSQRMGDVRRTDGIQTIVCYADISVQTPAYWKMDRYNDFAKAQRVMVNGIPERNYYNKKILKISFDGGDEPITADICRTITNLMNETFVTLFAENQCYIMALTPGMQEIPLTCSLEGRENCEIGENCIYIVEDSQLDIGLIETVQRNLGRIFSIICDYLDWHTEAAERSKNPPPEPVRKPVELPAEEKKEGTLKRLIGKLKKLFGRKAPEEKEQERIEKEEKEERREEEKNEKKDEAAAEGGKAAEAADLAKADTEFEPAHATRMNAQHIPARKPYHERFYLLYGQEEVPAAIAIDRTLDFLKKRGYGNSELKQAREGKALSGLAEGDYIPNQEGAHHCDFCGVELVGTEYEILEDGRERCMNCSFTAVKTEKEFVEIYEDVLDSMQSYFGIRINVPITVKMVNARRLHKALGKTFVPTGKADGRILGVAISDRSGYSLLLENGAPRISSMMTIAHELTHIWQYMNWDRKAISRKYGRNNETLIYEGMAKWVEIQYTYLINEAVSAKREEIITRLREDEYGKGFRIYESQYPLTEGTVLKRETPFMHKEDPIEVS